MVDLYALPPEEFTAARDAAVQLDPTLKALRRPTVSAWLVNLLVRREPALVEQLLSLGVQLAQAQRSGAAGALRDLGAQRRALVEAVAGRSLELGARRATTATRAEVVGTLEAALADADSAAAVRSGRLVRPLSYAGFGEVDLAGAVAPAGSGTAGSPTAGTPTRRRPPTRQAVATASGRAVVAAAERAAQEAAGTLDDAVRTAEQARQAADRARRTAEQAAQQEATAASRVADREVAVQTARQALVAAAETLTGRRDEQQQARTDPAAAERAAARAVTAVTRAQSGAAVARKTLHERRRGT